MFLYTLQFAHYPNELFSLSQGACTVLEGDFDAMLTTKLQSLWIPRQTYKGDGISFTINNNEFVIRLANLSLMGNFKGLLIHIQYLGNSSNSTEKINDLFQLLELPKVKEEQLTAKNRLDVAWKYIEALTR